MAEAVQRLLLEFPNISVTFAGEGPDEGFLHKTFHHCDQVKFIKYQSNESFDIHKDKDIAVIPTIGSEGTSLSLLEAMASRCAVICTNVGGMTNIVIDGYNGVIIGPTSDELYYALKQMILNPEQKSILADKAYDSVANGFSLIKWKEKWNKIINNVVGSVEEKYE